MKKRFIKKKEINWRRVFFNAQAAVLFPVLVPLIALNLLSDWLLTKWGNYGDWFLKKGN